MVQIRDDHRAIVKAIYERRATSANYGGDIEELAGALARIEADAKAAEREQCAKTLANECIRLVQAGEHDEARILARESQRLRGNYPESLRTTELPSEERKT